MGSVIPAALMAKLNEYLDCDKMSRTLIFLVDKPENQRFIPALEAAQHYKFMLINIVDQLIAPTCLKATENVEAHRKTEPGYIPQPVLDKLEHLLKDDPDRLARIHLFLVDKPENLRFVAALERTLYHGEAFKRIIYSLIGETNKIVHAPESEISQPAMKQFIEFLANANGP